MTCKPEMVIFDYGQTLIQECNFDAIKGNRALLNYAAKNPNRVTAEQIRELADVLDKDIYEALSIENKNHQKLELSDHSYSKYLYDYLDIEFSLTPLELESVFWDNAAPGVPTKNIDSVLEYLYQNGIRTAVVSNMMFSTQTLKRRIDQLLPKNHFEFILASSDYIFRKPHKRIFDLGLKKANVPAEKVWFCGDNLYCDIEGAYRAGMKPVWYTACTDLNQAVHTDAPYTRIDDWTQLIDLIETDN